MELLRLSSLPRGRPKSTKASVTPSCYQSTVLDLMYKRRRITYAHLQNAIAFRRLAAHVYSTSCGPVIANNVGGKQCGAANNVHRDVDFTLWRLLVHKIEIACGRRGVDLLVSTLFEDQDTPGLLEDVSIDVSTINTFRRALEVVGHVLHTHPLRCSV